MARGHRTYATEVANRELKRRKHDALRMRCKIRYDLKVMISNHCRELSEKEIKSMIVSELLEKMEATAGFSKEVKLRMALKHYDDLHQMMREIECQVSSVSYWD